MKHNDPEHHHHHCPWQSNWKSPVALGIFLLTAAVGVAILLYTLLNVGVSLVGIVHAPDEGQFMPQDLQTQSAVPSASDTGGTVSQ